MNLQRWETTLDYEDGTATLTTSGRYSDHNYEARRNLELSRFYKMLRIWFLLFCFLILSLAYPYLTHVKKPLAGLILLAVAYSIFRYRKKTLSLRNTPVYLILDCFDFLLIGSLVYLTGGVKSFFQIAFSVPILVCTVRFGLKFGFLSLGLTAVLTAINFLFAPDNFNYPIELYLLAGLGSFCFLIWTTSVLVKEEFRLRKELYTSSVTDHLTGLYHSGYVRERIREEIKRCPRTGGRFALAFLDLDLFKKVNDRFGHTTGDEVLKHVAGILKAAVRGGETLARYGGDEFLLLLCGAGREQAEQALQRMRHAIQNHPYFFQSQQVRLSISGGVAEYPVEGQTMEELLRVADQKMYRQKNGS